MNGGDAQSPLAQTEITGGEWAGQRRGEKRATAGARRMCGEKRMTTFRQLPAGNPNALG